MKEKHLHSWKHEHSFGQELRKPGETRTLVVIFLTSIMMLVEVSAGIVYGSMALLADGLHMASHAAALAINAVAYAYARRHAHDEAFSFGVGKVNTLGGYTGAILLAGFSLLMLVESINRLFVPVPIGFNQAIAVAVLGLIVNGVSVFILGVHEHDHDHDDHHEHDNEDEHHHHQHDHNLIAAYLHVLADALTSLLAIIALLFAKYFGATWMDPAMGIIGAILVARWSWGLLKTTSAILLDRQGSAKARQSIVQALEHDGSTRVVDLHLWAVGPKIYSLMISLVARNPLPVNDYKKLLPNDLTLDHVTIEVHEYFETHPEDSHHRV